MKVEDKKMLKNGYQAILEKYTEAEQKAIETRIRFAALMGVSKAPETEAEFQAYCDETIETIKKNEKAEQEKKEKANRRIEKKAHEMGMTVEDYKKYTRALRNAKSLEYKIKDMEKEVKQLQRTIKRYKEKINEWNAIAEEKRD